MSVTSSGTLWTSDLPHPGAEDLMRFRTQLAGSESPMMFHVTVGSKNENGGFPFTGSVRCLRPTRVRPLYYSRSPPLLWSVFLQMTICGMHTLRPRPSEVSLGGCDRLVVQETILCFLYRWTTPTYRGWRAGDRFPNER